MNRLILIGNGFDLAHGARTSYTQFIDDFWDNEIEKIKSELKTSNFISNDFYTVKNLDSLFLSGNRDEKIDDISDYKSMKLLVNRYGNLYLNDILIEKISEMRDSGFENWVDIEQTYYDLLKTKGEYEVKQLNINLERIKQKLVDFLSINKPKAGVVKETLREAIFQKFDLNDFSIEFKSYFNKMKVKIDDNNSVQGQGPKENDDFFFDSDIYYPNEILFLNFNYTDTYKRYTTLSDTAQKRKNKNMISKIDIHGSINEIKGNSIIFGYGDEMDEDYIKIEKRNNDYLENIKSIKYAETPNYKKLIKFLETDVYQVYIFGHSCGVSDRVLLNTIFEHNNCGSIKIYYHQREKDDNFNDIVKNVSRNFKDKSKMRIRLVEKEKSSTLS
ncbi:MAG: bacteriophage abortive infection AbiH family protein [Bacteroidetes bacterium]|nr:bacteriophage abortive infection AbiH family protein [Bacteroidota bacterium]